MFTRKVVDFLWQVSYTLVSPFCETRTEHTASYRYVETATGTARLDRCPGLHPSTTADTQTVDRGLNARVHIGNDYGKLETPPVAPSTHDAEFSACVELSRGLFQVRKWPAQSTVVSK